MKKFSDPVLYTPGPARVPERILHAMAKPALHHRSAEFSDILKDLFEKWRWLFGTKQPVLPVHTTGRGAMEAVLTNFLSPNDSIICVANGFFGYFFSTIGGILGLKVHNICTDWQKPVSVEEVEAAIKAHPEARAITICHNESSTGTVVADIAAIGALAKRAGMLTVVDAVSSGGCARIDFDAWNVDALVVASQKGLMCPAGMSLVILSDDGYKACESGGFPKYYTNFLDIRKGVLKESPDTPGSTPVSLVYALHESVNMMFEEGRDQVFARHEIIAKAVRAGLRALDCTLLPEGTPERNRSVSLTAFVPPNGLSMNDCKKALKEMYGINIAGAIGPLDGQLLRVGHMGYIYERDVLLFFACLQGVIAHFLGTNKQGGLEAAQAVFAGKG